MEADLIDLTRNSSLQEWISLSAPKEPIWVCDTESRVVRIAKDILSVLIFPIGIARVLHRIVGNFIVPAARITKGLAILSFVAKIPVLGTFAAALKTEIEDVVKQKFNESLRDWNVQRVAIHVDGRVVDAAIVTRKAKVDIEGTTDEATKVRESRWTLISGGNGEYIQFLSHLNVVGCLQSNAVYYNYPGVMGSTGNPSRSTIAKTSRVMLQFLQGPLHARQIIWYGHSLGGGVQEAFSDHYRGTNYCLVKSRTFSQLSKVVQDMFGGYRIIRILVQVLGWNMNPLASVQREEVHQVILQTASISDQIIGDTVISKEASLAVACEANDQTAILPIREWHNEQLQDKDYHVKDGDQEINYIGTLKRLKEAVNKFLATNLNVQA